MLRIQALCRSSDRASKYLQAWNLVSPRRRLQHGRGVSHLQNPADDGVDLSHPFKSVGISLAEHRAWTEPGVVSNPEIRFYQIAGRTLHDCTQICIEDCEPMIAVLRFFQCICGMVLGPEGVRTRGRVHRTGFGQELPSWHWCLAICWRPVV